MLISRQNSVFSYRFQTQCPIPTCTSSFVRVDLVAAGTSKLSRVQLQVHLLTDLTPGEFMSYRLTTADLTVNREFKGKRFLFNEPFLIIGIVSTKIE